MDKPQKRKSSSTSKGEDIDVLIQSVQMNGTKKKKIESEWERSFNSLAKPKANFCDDCGFLLPLTADNEIHCKMCGFVVRADELESHVIITRAKPKSSIRKKAKKDDNSNDRAIIDEKCPECGHGKMYFYTMQLRSVDEGSTVFYECVECAYKFSVNN